MRILALVVSGIALAIILSLITRWLFIGAAALAALSTLAVAVLWFAAIGVGGLALLRSRHDRLRRLRLRLRLVRPAVPPKRLIAVIVAALIVQLAVGGLLLLSATDGPTLGLPIQGFVLRSAPNPVAGWLLSFLFLVILAPFGEEVALRGWIQGGLEQITRPIVAIGLTALVFTVLHWQYWRAPGYLLLPFALGGVCGLAVAFAQSVWPAIILHGLWNALLAVTAPWRSAFASLEAEVGLGATAGLAVLFLAGTAWFWVLARREQTPSAARDTATGTA